VLAHAIKRVTGTIQRKYLVAQHTALGEFVVEVAGVLSAHTISLLRVEKQLQEQESARHVVRDEARKYAEFHRETEEKQK
jgi:hypothetical protein